MAGVEMNSDAKKRRKTETKPALEISSCPKQRFHFSRAFMKSCEEKMQDPSQKNSEMQRHGTCCISAGSEESLPWPSFCFLSRRKGEAEGFIAYRYAVHGSL